MLDIGTLRASSQEVREVFGDGAALHNQDGIAFGVIIRVILSGVAASRSEAAAESKDPYRYKESGRLELLLTEPRPPEFHAAELADVVR